MCRFWTLFQFPAGSPSRVNFSCSKLLCFIALLKLSRWKLLENDSFKWIAPTLWPKKCSKWSQAIYRSLRFKDTFSKCFKTEAPQLWRNIGDQMRELACFALFSLSARTAHRPHLKKRAPQKSDHKTQRKSQKSTKTVFQPLGAGLGPMFSIVGCWLAGCWLVEEIGYERGVLLHVYK